MNLVNITPIMTSDTTPEPYSCSSSTGNVYKAFDNNSRTYWSSNAHATSASIIFNFGEITPIYCITAVGSNNSSSGADINKIIVYGLNDDNEWILIKELKSNISSTNNSTVHTFYLDEQVTYKSYKFDIITNNGTGRYMRLSEIKMYQDTDQITFKNKIKKLF